MAGQGRIEELETEVANANAFVQQARMADGAQPSKKHSKDTDKGKMGQHLAQKWHTVFTIEHFSPSDLPSSNHGHGWLEHPGFMDDFPSQKAPLKPGISQPCLIRDRQLTEKMASSSQQLTQQLQPGIPNCTS